VAILELIMQSHFRSDVTEILFTGMHEKGKKKDDQHSKEHM